MLGISEKPAVGSTVFKLACVASFVAAMTACSGGGTGDAPGADSGVGMTDDPITGDDGSVTSIVATVTVPDGETGSGVTVLSKSSPRAAKQEVDNATISVRIVQNDGSLVTVDATVEPLGNGQYSITLPEELQGLAADCIVIAEAELSGGTVTLRAPFVQTELSVDPASEFLVQQVLQDPSNIGNFSVDEIRQALIDVQDIELSDDQGDSIDAVLASLEEAVGPSTRENLATAGADNAEPASSISVAGAYNGLWFNVGYFGSVESGNTFSDYSGSGAEYRLSTEAGENGALTVTRFEERELDFFLSTSDNSFYFLGVEQDIDFSPEGTPEELASLRTRALSDGSFVIRGRSEVEIDNESVSDSRPQADVFTFSDWRFSPSGDGELYVATFRARENVYAAIDTDGDGFSDAADYSMRQEVGLERELNLLTPTSTTALAVADFNGTYRQLGIGTVVESSGDRFHCTETSVFELDDGAYEETEDTDACIDRQSGSVMFSRAEGTLDFGTYSTASGGVITFDFEDDDDVDEPAFHSPSSDYIFGRFVEGEDGQFAEIYQSLSIRVPSQTPAMDGLSFRLQGVGLSEGEAGNSTISSQAAGVTMTFTSNAAGVSLEIDNVVDFLERDSDSAAPTLLTESFEDSFVGGQDMGNGHIQWVLQGGGRLDAYVGLNADLVMVNFSTPAGADSDAEVFMGVATPLPSISSAGQPAR